MACTSFRNWNFFKSPRIAFGVRPCRRPSDHPFLWFGRRTEVQKVCLNAVQADMGRRDIQGTSTANGLHYTVKEGDTLTSIARKFKTSVQLIALSNQIDDVDYILVGKELLVSTQSSNLNEVSTNGDDLDYLSTPSGCPSKAEPSIASQKGSMPLIPMVSSSLFSQIHLVTLASTLVVVFAVFIFAKRYLGKWVEAKIDKEVVKRQAEKEIHDAHHRPKLRRWQEILDEDREKYEPDLVLSSDAPISLKSEMSSRELEEEKLRQSYAQLECVYAKFLVDSGLSKSGYWRGGVPPATEEG